ncbi:MAG: nitrogenase-associated protein [Desertifilum sp.]|nr:ArsC/Spx/MgsR family protein [Oscillatoria laete-virens]MCD8486362.1 nitrogenase-associated protein [Desertifilum sp.]MDL5053539.1 ArsC/Spx/MgsR family protein [Oscillatoria laete-virens NRMC-F 0139]
MASVIFFEKPGCINNTKQKALLQSAGHQVEARNLLSEPWRVATLRPFFGDLPVAEWFNRTAPQIKSGEVIPGQLEEETALNLMMSNPLLIRRPLMQVGDRRMVGFDMAQVAAWIGLEVIEESQQALMDQDLQTCPKSNPL